PILREALYLIHKHKLIRHQQHLSVFAPGLHRRRGRALEAEAREPFAFAAGAVVAIGGGHHLYPRMPRERIMALARTTIDHQVNRVAGFHFETLESARGLAVVRAAAPQHLAVRRHGRSEYAVALGGAM